MIATLFLLLGVCIGYRVGEIRIKYLREDNIRKMGVITQFEAKLDRYEKYVPKTEKYKNEIVRMHYRGYTGRQISMKLGIDQSAVNRAIRRWKLK